MAENVLCEHSSNSGVKIEYVGRHELLKCLVCHRLSVAVNMFTAKLARDVLIKISLACNCKDCYSKQNIKFIIDKQEQKLFECKHAS